LLAGLGAAVADGVAVGVGYRQAELAVGVAGGALGDLAGEGGVQDAEGAGLSCPLGVAGGGEERDVEVPQDQVDLRRHGRPGLAGCGACSGLRAGGGAGGRGAAALAGGLTAGGLTAGGLTAGGTRRVACCLAPARALPLAAVAAGDAPGRGAIGGRGVIEAEAGAVGVVIAGAGLARGGT
jgi:hypothetical protein